jgi:hypothetical protein
VGIGSKGPSHSGARRFGDEIRPLGLQAVIALIDGFCYADALLAGYPAADKFDSIRGTEA